VTTTTRSQPIEKPKVKKADTLQLPRSARRLIRSPMAIIGATIVIAFILAGITAELIAPYDYDQSNFSMARQGPSAEHWLGNDELGRDMLSRLLFGARISLLLGIMSVGIGLSIGVPLGIIGGYTGGFVDLLITGFIDILLAFPSILLAIMMVAILGPSLENAMIAIGVLSIPIYTRLVRSSTIGLKEDLFIEAARSMGASHWQILTRHIFPNVLAPITVQSSLQMAVAIQAAAALGFLGLGAPPDVPEWGNMLQKGRTYVFSAPHIVIFPGLATMMVVFGFSLFGDGLRDALDPRLNK
jgi:ABC-type dipeptide/oligopeptide/nickel transport system permease subunit